MDYPRKIVWSEGDFLTPQHFQYLDQYHEHLLTERLNARSGFEWGIVECHIDQNALLNSNIAITDFKGVMPDGMLLDLGSQNSFPQARNIDEQYFPAGQDHLDVFLGIPVQHSRDANCRLEQTASHPRPPRFNREYRELLDYNTGNKERAIGIARANTRILVGNDDSSDYLTIKIAEIIRVPRGSLAVSDRYVPPCMTISASPYLMQLLRGLLDVLFAKRRELNSRARTLANSQADRESLAVLFAINGALPLLSHAACAERMHPESLYVTLIRLAGELSTVMPQLDPNDFPRYCHTDLGRTFREIEMQIRDAVQREVEEKYVSIPLTLRAESIWVGEIVDNTLLQTADFYISVTGDLPAEKLHEITAKKIKIGSLEDLEMIVTRALPGVRIAHAQYPPLALNPLKDHHYFKLEKQGNSWEAIVRTHTIGINNSSKSNELRLELLAIKN